MVGVLLLIQQRPPRMAGCLVCGKEYEGSLGFDFFMRDFITSTASQLNTLDGQGDPTANNDNPSESAERETRKKVMA